MSNSRRAQILMDPDEYTQLESLAYRRHTSVGALIREAVRLVYLRSPEDRLAAANAIAGMSLPDVAWEDAKQWIDEAYDAGLR